MGKESSEEKFGMIRLPFVRVEVVKTETGSEVTEMNTEW